jgi:aryl-alcohol dehydrogenase-like predicted oxidoreductase
VNNFFESQLILGTVQLGLPYGIANETGQPPEDQAFEMIRLAVENGVLTFDTAQSYGTSEAVLGNAINQLGNKDYIKIITKLPHTFEVANARRLLAESMQRLQVQEIHCLMLHKEEQLVLLDGALGDELHSYLELGLIHHIGVSVYTPEAALAALQHPSVSIVQVPASVFDRRFEQAGVFEIARQNSKSVHIRSALLQGVLCMTPDKLPSYLISLAEPLTAFRQLCYSHQIAPAHAAIGWLLFRYPGMGVIFGADSPEQLVENMELLSKFFEVTVDFWSKLSSICPEQSAALLNPTFWKKHE